jgi:hypothetical protein
LAVTYTFSATKARSIGSGFTPRTEPLLAAPRAEQPRSFAAEAEAQRSGARLDGRTNARVAAARACAMGAVDAEHSQHNYASELDSLPDDRDYSTELPGFPDHVTELPPVNFSWQDGDDEDVTSIATLLQNVQPHSAICCMLSDTAATRAFVPLCAAHRESSVSGSKSPLFGRSAQTPRFRGTSAHQAEGGGLNRDGSRRTPPNTPHDAFASRGSGAASPPQRVIAGVQRGDINIWHISYDTVRPLPNGA